MKQQVKPIAFMTVFTLIILLCNSCVSFKTNIKPLNDYPHWHERMEIFIAEKDSIKDACHIYLGDSIIEGFDLKTFFPNDNTINRGIVSDHIDGLIKRMNICLGDVNDAKLFVSIGINDIGAKRSEKEIKYLYRKMLNKIDNEYNYEVYLHSILPTSPRWKNCPPELIKDMNIYIEKLAKRHNMIFVNIYPLFKNDTNDYIKDELTRDGLHPNKAGYKIWADHLKNIVK